MRYNSNTDGIQTGDLTVSDYPNDLTGELTIRNLWK